MSGTRTVELLQNDFYAILNNYEKVHIDLGTGDARNIYRLAKKNPTTFYIGIDPVKDNMYEISKKTVKKTAKGGLPNILLVIASIEHLPYELNDIADSISIFFPWGSLLECIIKPVEDNLLNISKVAKNFADFEFVTTYSDAYEEGEILRRNLPFIDAEYFQNSKYVSAMNTSGFDIEDVEMYDNEYVKQFHSQWSKRLAFGRKRCFFRIYGKIIKDR